MTKKMILRSMLRPVAAASSDLQRSAVANLSEKRLSVTTTDNNVPSAHPHRIGTFGLTQLHPEKPGSWCYCQQNPVLAILCLLQQTSRSPHRHLFSADNTSNFWVSFFWSNNITLTKVACMQIHYAIYEARGYTDPKMFPATSGTECGVTEI